MWHADRINRPVMRAARADADDDDDGTFDCSDPDYLDGICLPD